MPNNRILFLDTSRAMAMFLVVFAHLYAGDSQERLYIYAFHMPFFFLISGMLHKQMPVLKGAIKHTKTLLIPTLSYLIICGIVSKLFFGWHFMQYVKTCWVYGVNGWEFPLNGPVWFLIALFYVKILADLYFSNKAIALVLWGTTMYLTSVYTNPFFLCSGMMAVPFYLLGTYSKQWVIRMSQIDWIKWSFPLFFAASVALTLINGRVSMVAHNFGYAPTPYNYALFYINGIIGSLGMICLSLFIKRPLKFITTIGTSLITIVGLQQLFLELYNNHIASDSYLLTIPATIVIIAICCMAHWLIGQYFPFLLGKRILPTFDDYYGTIHDFVCSFLPLQKKIVFDNFGGRGMGDDPKYIALYIKKHYPDVKLIWLLADMNTPMPDGITPVFINSRKARYHLYTARIWVDNIRNFRKTPKRKGQFYLQTWHGGAIEGPKCCEALAEAALSIEYVMAAKHDAEITDLMYTDNDFTKAIYENHYWYKGDVLKCDLPRLSIFKNTPKELKSQIFSYFNIDDHKKIVLYAPTFRKTEDTSILRWDYEHVLEKFSEKYRSDFVMLLRLHPNFSSLSKTITYTHRVIAATDYPDMQELLAISDILITDYSGCMFDYAITEKPIFLYCPDIDSYCSNDRQLLFNLKDLPFTVSTSEKELYDNIINFNDENYKKKLESFYNRLGFSDSGTGNKTVSELLTKRLWKNLK